MENGKMQIEKVSKYIPVSTPSRSSEQTTMRQMMVSLPRVKWLERDIDNCEYYKKYRKPEEVKPSIAADLKRSPTWCARLKGEPLTPQEQKVADLRVNHHPTAIGRKLGLAPSTVRGMLARIRAKNGEYE